MFIVSLNNHTICVVPENIHTPPTEGLEFPGGWGVPWEEKFNKTYEAKLKFPERQGDAKKNPYYEGGMNIFWNCTLFVF